MISKSNEFLKKVSSVLTYLGLEKELKTANEFFTLCYEKGLVFDVKLKAELTDEVDELTSNANQLRTKVEEYEDKIIELQTELATCQTELQKERQKLDFAGNPIEKTAVDLLQEELSKKLGKEDYKEYEKIIDLSNQINDDTILHLDKKDYRAYCHNEQV